MNATLNAFEAVAHECTAGSDASRLTFPQVVGKLIDAGAERYHADLTRAEKTYYLPSGESIVVPCAKLDSEPAAVFSAAAVEAAVREIQRGELTYHSFCERISAAGCVDYVVSIAGRCAIYSGRTGESYVEPFPAK